MLLSAGGQLKELATTSSQLSEHGRGDRDHGGGRWTGVCKEDHSRQLAAKETPTVMTLTSPKSGCCRWFWGVVKTPEAALKTVIQGNTATCENCLRDEWEFCTFVLFGKVWRGLNEWRVHGWSGETNKRANGLMHIDAAGLMILAHTLPILCPGARWEQLCWGGWADWGLQRLSLYPLLSYRRHQGSGVQHWCRASCRVVVSQVIRHVTPAGLAAQHAHRCTFAILRFWKDEWPWEASDPHTCLLLCDSVLN